MDWQHLAIIGLTAAASVQFWIIKMLWTKTEQTQKNLYEHAQRDAEIYVTKDDHQEVQRTINQKLDKILDKLDKKADK